MARENGTVTSLIDRVTGAVKGFAAGFTGEWNAPGEPMPQQSPPGSKPRQFSYRPSINKTPQPRAEEGVTFDQMRQLADNCDLLRLVIEKRKDQMSKLLWRWRVQRKPGESPEAYKTRNENDPRLAEVAALFKFPDGSNNFRTWIRMLMEDALVLDAVFIEPRRERKTKYLRRLELIDGSTIKPLIDETGRTPQPPLNAYQQVLFGLVHGEWKADEAMYCVRNRRTNHSYGYSPVEQIILTVNQALRRAMFQLSHYTEGNVGTAFIPVPDSWTLDDVQEMQEYWDELISGKPDEQAKVHFIPHGMAPIFPQAETLKDDFDEWLARIICYAFSVSHTSLVKNMNRATSEQNREQADEEGIMAWALYVKDILEECVLRWFGYADLEVVYRFDRPQDSFKQAQVDQIYYETGIKSIDEIRGEIALDPIGISNGVKIMKGFFEFSKDEDGTVIAAAPRDSERPSETAKVTAQINATARQKELETQQSAKALPPAEQSANPEEE